MCGIVGYRGGDDARGFLLEALKRMEYRGYDSAGIATIGADSSIHLEKRAGPVSYLESSMNGGVGGSRVGIGHTRWATHGAVTDGNAHPHLSYDGSVAIAHNGIIENYMELRRRLASDGVRLRSDTDSEVVSHLIAQRMDSGASLLDATRLAAYELEGLSVIVSVSSREPDAVVGARSGYAGSLILCTCEGEGAFASSLEVMPSCAGDYVYLDHCEAGMISGEGVSVVRLDGTPIKKVRVALSDRRLAEKGDHAHFMHKEILEQASSLQGAMRGRVDFSAGAVSVPSDAGGSVEGVSRLAGCSRAVFCGMGSSYFVALSGSRWLERFAGIPSQAEHSGELSDRGPILGSDTAFVAVTQSGETYDTLEALELARRSDCDTVLVTANGHSQGARMAREVLDIGAGLEVAVAATKTVTSSMLTLYLMALELGVSNGNLSAEDAGVLVGELASLPRLTNQTLSLESGVRELASEYLSMAGNVLFLGRGDLYPMALEGALKMKEVSYIHAEGCTASEMKHGINALIDVDTPTVALVPSEGASRVKMMSSINEVQARGGLALAVGAESDIEVASLADGFIGVPDAPLDLQPFLHVVVLQLLAYHASLLRGVDPDRPRNLAKTVTVA